jgi:hypothetical protein
LFAVGSEFGDGKNQDKNQDPGWKEIRIPDKHALSATLPCTYWYVLAGFEVPNNEDLKKVLCHLLQFKN